MNVLYAAGGFCFGVAACKYGEAFWGVWLLAGAALTLIGAAVEHTK